MIHLNVAFLVNRSTFNTIVKILINASLLVVNKFYVQVLLQNGGWKTPPRRALLSTYIQSTDDK